jgi:hypothetical protein
MGHTDIPPKAESPIDFYLALQNFEDAVRSRMKYNQSRISGMNKATPRK